jgi:hypothetical protein
VQEAARALHFATYCAALALHAHCLECNAQREVLYGLTSQTETAGVCLLLIIPAASYRRKHTHQWVFSKHTIACCARMHPLRLSET